MEYTIRKITKECGCIIERKKNGSCYIERHLKKCKECKEKDREFMDKREKTCEKDLKKIIGKKLLKVEWFYNGPFDSGFLLTFEDNIKLKAQDGEYGNNAFEIIK